MPRYNGIVAMNKDIGMTSHDVIAHLRRITGQKKIGHTGTLDPLASGLLLICFGRATKLTQFLSDWNKCYRAKITLGYVSDTLDGGGQIVPSGEVPELTVADLERIFGRFTGRVEQKTPVYSAVKVGGRELYKYARKGIDVETPVREVEISSLKLVSFESPVMIVDVGCSKGTYIRALADDIGREIGCGAFLSGLKRTEVGPYGLDRAVDLTEIEDRHKNDRLKDLIQPIEDVLDFPIIRIRREAAKTIKFGGLIKSGDMVTGNAEFCAGDLLSIADEEGCVMAIGKAAIDSRALAGDKNAEFFAYVRVLS